jgi:hypothetical protein
MSAYAAMAARLSRDCHQEGRSPKAGDVRWASRETPASFRGWTNSRQRAWLAHRRDARSRLGLCLCCGGGRPCAGELCSKLGYT